MAEKSRRETCQAISAHFGFMCPASVLTGARELIPEPNFKAHMTSKNPRVLKKAHSYGLVNTVG